MEPAKQDALITWKIFRIFRMRVPTLKYMGQGALIWCWKIYELSHTKLPNCRGHFWNLWSKGIPFEICKISGSILKFAIRKASKFQVRQNKEVILEIY